MAWMPRGFYAEFCLCGGSSEERGLLLLQKPHMSPWVLLVLPAAERAQGRGEAPQGGGGGRPRWLRLEQRLLPPGVFCHVARMVSYSVRAQRPGLVAAGVLTARPIAAIQGPLQSTSPTPCSALLGKQRTEGRGVPAELQPKHFTQKRKKRREEMVGES